MNPKLQRESLGLLIKDLFSKISLVFIKGWRWREWRWLWREKSRRSIEIEEGCKTMSRYDGSIQMRAVWTPWNGFYCANCTFLQLVVDCKVCAFLMLCNSEVWRLCMWNLKWTFIYFIQLMNLFVLWEKPLFLLFI